MCCFASTATGALSASTDDLRVTTLVDNFEGKRLNAPNDLVYRSDGTLFFTDPPYGLPRQDDDPEKDLPFNGVFKLVNGKAEVIIKDLTRPNGIAFSPDERTLYVSNSDDKRRIWMRYDIAPSGDVTNGRVFFDTTAHEDGGLPDGMKIDVHGNVWATGPSAVSCSRPPARTWARSSRRKILRTAAGATMAGRFTLRLRRGFIASKRR